MHSLHETLARSSTRPAREPAWDPDASPETPWPLVEAWLTAAVDDGLPSVGTAVLATAAADGAPSARVVLLQDLGDEGAWIAVGADSPAGRDLAANPRAALVLHLREHARQIRLDGAVVRGDAGRSAAAFLARGAHSRATTIAGDQSAPLPRDAGDLVDAALPAQRSDDPPVDPRWTAWLVAPTSVELWQSTREDGERRLRYRREGTGWTRERLWP